MIVLCLSVSVVAWLDLLFLGDSEFTNERKIQLQRQQQEFVLNLKSITLSET